MKKITNLLSMVLLMLCMGLTSCDDILGQFDNPFGPLSISVNSIDLDADEMTLTVGDVGQLIATVGPENATDKTVTWTSSKESVATVDATGKVTAIAEGTATIKAKAGSISTTCIVTVKAATVAVTSVTLDKTELALTVGDAAVQLTATVKPDNATDADVDWSSSDQSVATVDGSGLVTAVADGTATITAKAGDKTAECKVTISKADSDYLAWDGTQKKLVATEIPTDATAVSNASGNVNWAAGTYVVDGNVTISGVISLQGAVNLIIKDGAKLTVGRIDGANYDLSIFGQSNMTGELVVKNNTRHAIHSLSTLEIHSCKVTALGVLNGRWGLDDIGTINVYGGSVDSKASENGYGNGICLKNAGSMNIYGGLVKAEGKGSFSTNCYGVEGSGSATITVYGGKLWAGSPNKQAFGSNVTLTKGASFTGKIQTSNDNSTWTDWTTAGTPTTKYVKVE